MNNSTEPFYKTMATANSIDESTAVALMATVFNGIAQPDSTFVDLAGEAAIPPVGVALVEDSLSTDYIERLLYPARQTQSKLNDRFHRLDLNILKEVLTGGNEEGMRNSQSYLEHEKAVLGTGVFPKPKHEIRLSFGMEVVDNDMCGSDLLRRLDLVVRPSFLLESPDLETLQESISRLHRSSGLLWGGRHFSIDDLEGRKLGKLFSMLQRGQAKLPDILCGGRKNIREPARISYILKASSESLGRDEAKTFLRDTLLLQATPGHARGLPTGAQSHSAYHAWCRLTDWALWHRRHGGEELLHAVGTEHEAFEFEERYRDYRQRCEEAGVDSQAVFQLPKLLLCLPIMGGRLEPRLHIGISESFRHSEILRDRHIRLRQKANIRTQVLETIELAGKILERISRRQPLSQRDLFRSFDKQNKEIYLPTMVLMQEAGLIVENPEKVYRLGNAGDIEAALTPILENRHLRAVA